MNSVPSEKAILEALHKVSASGVFTWVLAEQFRERGYGTSTDWMRSRLSVLERQGKVKRVASRMANQIVWRAV